MELAKAGRLTVRARIHRGAREIGGTCVELEHDGARLLLDLGRPLESPLDADVPLPTVAGLADPDPALAGLIVSHGHPDHHGLVPQVDASVPVFVGEAAERILRVAAFWSPAGADLRVAGHLRDRRELRIGPFTVTPYLTDHSAFDSYALLVEAGGRRLFYSGDLRAHGRKARLVEQLLVEPPANVDALLLEGTNVGRGGSSVSERDARRSAFSASARLRGSCSPASRRRTSTGW